MTKNFRGQDLAEEFPNFITSLHPPEQLVPAGIALVRKLIQTPINKSRESLINRENDLQMVRIKFLTMYYEL
jgi:hypothetical protein